jgi:hypothetical protein
MGVGEPYLPASYPTLFISMSLLPPLPLTSRHSQSATSNEALKPDAATFGVRLYAIGHMVPSVDISTLHHLQREVSHVLGVALINLLSSSPSVGKGRAKEKDDASKVGAMVRWVGLWPTHDACVFPISLPIPASRDLVCKMTRFPCPAGGP